MLVKSVSFRLVSINLEVLFSWFNLQFQDFCWNRIPGIVILSLVISKEGLCPDKIMGALNLKKRDNFLPPLQHLFSSWRC